MATSATQVFQTTELVEKILLELSVRDVLVAMRVDRTMRNTVLGSTAIKQSIGLLPDHNANFRALPWESPAIDRLHHKQTACTTDFHFFTFTNFAGKFVYNYIFFDRRNESLTAADFMILSKCNGTLRRMGTRVRALSISQPPTTQLEICVLCDLCHNTWIYCFDALTPSNGQYITFGDLYQANLRIRMKHRQQCKFPDRRADLTVEFIGRVDIKEDDPIVYFRKVQGDEKEPL